MRNLLGRDLHAFLSTSSEYSLSVVEQIASSTVNDCYPSVARGRRQRPHYLDTGDVAASASSAIRKTRFRCSRLPKPLPKIRSDRLELSKHGSISAPCAVQDINVSPISWHGINVAKRVGSSPSLPSPGSRSYYEIVSRLSEESSKLFTYEGSRTDKHIREHEVYGVGDVSALPRRTQNKRLTGALDNALGRHVGAVSSAAKSAIDRVAAKPRVATFVAVTAILSVAIFADVSC